ncbi:phosphopantetheine adenylyltransferase [Ketogulonicigenium vulgare Y25]|uniref:Phosphopantetheine adenylyltransferase n=1 Tax=Ketogulonicigenium vulgare (strain WSH-001) TaxID=759362 RepID=F9YAI3_KETVW|nr:pantetheine-phosphate adenylyltransferase [Ketogulonicigenium vulgare]ADO43220.1 phosphopantetheine adenylyltransferase [Ketogulonicigenium vulgare Y25]AEM41514.1 Phosphopantetheine adenylyltransferase (Pantetheine-Phosphate adenylyltransferase) protein [Ketogulonicigenium vulgare WSH-001]ALJ81639.1 phosphopantetheine adenylyltransferase [Ketogulonicigenium vulgare]AOZ55256.1 phosphopantetheine adenylyltransferase [Ketogulonicigenium vulgare]
MRIGLYPGTFDPVTNGHLDIIRRGAALVDRLVIGVAINAGKGPLFGVDERVALLEVEVAAIPADIAVVPFETLLVDFAGKVGAQVIIRGLRGAADFEYEFPMTGMNRTLAPDIETVFLMAEARHQAIASRLVKEVSRLGGDVSAFVPPGVQQALADRWK